MSLEKFNIIRDLIDWYSKAGPLKKMYIRGTVFLISIGLVIWYCDQRIERNKSLSDKRYDDMSANYITKLAECNAENKAEYRNLLSILSVAIEKQRQAEIEQAKVDIELEKIK